MFHQLLHKLIDTPVNYSPLVLKKFSCPSLYIICCELCSCLLDLDRAEKRNPSSQILLKAYHTLQRVQERIMYVQLLAFLRLPVYTVLKLPHQAACMDLYVPG